MRTGHLGPVILGMSPKDVMDALGEPEGASRKSNPLVLKYGCVQLSFWKAPNQGVPQLREIVITYQPVFEAAPESLAFRDWSLNAPPTEGQFKLFVQQIDYPPAHLVEGASGRQLLFPSGVTALFADGMLHSIRLVEREQRSSPPAALTDEREPTLDQIHEMLNEAEQVSQIGAHRAALLIAWAAPTSLHEFTFRSTYTEPAAITADFSRDVRHLRIHALSCLKDKWPARRRLIRTRATGMPGSRARQILG